LTPQLLKPAVADALIELTAPIRAAFEASPEWQEVILKAYPPPVQEKKKKKSKDKGSRHPGAGGGKAPNQAKSGEQTDGVTPVDNPVSELKISE
jgi:tyrosyl-tRNA synthetase